MLQDKNTDGETGRVEGEAPGADTRPAAERGGRAAPEPERSEPDGQGKSPEAEGQDGDAGGEGEVEPSRGALDIVREHKVAVAVGLVVLLAAIVAGTVWYLAARHWESTDDAFIDSRVFSIAPKVSGYLSEVPVTDNQYLEAGAVVARIDPRDYDASLDQANAQVQAAEAAIQSALAQAEAQQSQIAEARAQVVESEAAVNFARDENARAQELVQKGAGTVQRAQQTASQLTQSEATLARSRAALNAATRQLAVLDAQRKSAEASLAQARAQRDQARLNVSYTEIRADQPGRVSRLTGAKGQLVQAGQALSMFVPDVLWVTANYKETQLTDMRPGQEVEMTIDAYPDRKLTGHVESIQRGSGTAFSLLPAQNATGNYVKVVQRVPVKLVFDALPGDVAIGPGMSVVPRVRVR